MPVFTGAIMTPQFFSTSCNACLELLLWQLDPCIMDEMSSDKQDLLSIEKGNLPIHIKSSIFSRFGTGAEDEDDPRFFLLPAFMVEAV